MSSTESTVEVAPAGCEEGGDHLLAEGDGLGAEDRASPAGTSRGGGQKDQKAEKWWISAQKWCYSGDVMGI